MGLQKQLTLKQIKLLEQPNTCMYVRYIYHTKQYTVLFIIKQYIINFVF